MIKNKKKIISLLTLSLISSVSCTNKERKQDENTFQTHYGMKYLKEYKDYLEMNGINYENARAHAEGDDVVIKEKCYSEYIIEPDKPNTIDDIVNFYNMEKDEFLNLNNLEETEKLKKEQKVTVYFTKYYYFSLEELEESKKYYYYKIAENNTLTQIVENYDVTLEEILETNEFIENPDIIKKDTIIKIPKKKEEKTK